MFLLQPSFQPYTLPPPSKKTYFILAFVVEFSSVDSLYSRKETISGKFNFWYKTQLVQYPDWKLRIVSKLDCQSIQLHLARAKSYNLTDVVKTINLVQPPHDAYTLCWKTLLSEFIYLYNSFNQPVSFLSEILKPKIILVFLNLLPDPLSLLKHGSIYIETGLY